LVEFAPIAPGELIEGLRDMPVPFTQFSAGRDLFDPLVDMSLGAGHPAGPQPIDEHPASRAGPDVVVDPADLNIDGSTVWPAGRRRWAAEAVVALRGGQARPRSGKLRGEPFELLEVERGKGL
jgi:hypothetical protein